MTKIVKSLEGKKEINAVVTPEMKKDKTTERYLGCSMLKFTNKFQNVVHLRFEKILWN
jgi:hypothetical protein